MMIIDDWLEDKLAERKFAFAAPAEPEECAMFAGMLRAEALASGYTVEALEGACGGDISTYVSGKMLSQSLSAAPLTILSAIHA